MGGATNRLIIARSAPVSSSILTHKLVVSQCGTVVLPQTNVAVLPNASPKPMAGGIATCLKIFHKRHRQLVLLPRLRLVVQPELQQVFVHRLVVPLVHRQKYQPDRKPKVRLVLQPELQPELRLLPILVHQLVLLQSHPLASLRRIQLVLRQRHPLVSLRRIPHRLIQVASSVLTTIQSASRFPVLQNHSILHNKLDAHIMMLDSSTGLRCLHQQSGKQLTYLPTPE